MAHLRRFFHSSVRRLTAAYENIAADQAFNDIRPSICDQMRHEIANIKEEIDQPQASGGEILILAVHPKTTPSPV